MKTPEMTALKQAWDKSTVKRDGDWVRMPMADFEAIQDSICDVFQQDSDAREGMVPFDMPKLMPNTAKLVLAFAKALADKLAAAEVKYGYGDSWATPDAEDWPHPKCYTDLVKHLQKGDPRDVAIYCAFLWYHKLSTSKCLEMAGMVPAAELRPTIELLHMLRNRYSAFLHAVTVHGINVEIARLETLLVEKGETR